MFNIGLRSNPLYAKSNEPKTPTRDHFEYAGNQLIGAASEYLLISRPGKKFYISFVAYHMTGTSLSFGLTDLSDAQNYTHKARASLNTDEEIHLNFEKEPLIFNNKIILNIDRTGAIPPVSSLDFELVGLVDL